MLSSDYSRWMFRLLLLVICLLVLLTGTVPGLPGAGHPLTPDILFCVTIAWLVRQPDHLPPIMLVILYLLRDIVLGQPVGLWTSAMLLAGLAAVMLRGWLMTRSFITEWAVAMVLHVSVLLFVSIVLTVALLPGISIEFLGASVLATALAYPLVALFIRYVCRIRWSIDYPDKQTLTWP